MSCHSGPHKKIENYKSGNSNGGRVSCKLRLLLSIGGYGLLLEVDQRLNNRKTQTWLGNRDLRINRRIKSCSHLVHFIHG